MPKCVICGKKSKNNVCSVRCSDIRYWLESLPHIDLDVEKKMRKHLIRVLLKLPKDALEKVLRSNVFFIFPRAEGQYYYFPRSYNGCHVIFVKVMPNKSGKYIERTIAHEIAHYVLGHRNRGDEKEAEDLVRKWFEKALNK
jgi:hypothetical protein